MKMLILGASYGSLLSTKLLMAGHDVTLICRSASAALINSEGTQVRIKLRDEDVHRAIRSADLPGSLNAVTPEQARPEDYDMIALAMQEPQYSVPSVRGLMARIAASGKPCLSIMNMPPLPYLKRIPDIAAVDIEACYTEAAVWSRFDPAMITLASPDPQAFRPLDEPVNHLQVSLPTNFKVARFESDLHTAILKQLEQDIMAIRFDPGDGTALELPVKLKVYESVFVPLAKWAMLCTGNYRCVTAGEARAICDAVHTDLDASASIYAWVREVCEALGADISDLVPFEKYANAAQGLAKPSSAARALYAGALNIERVDKLVQILAASKGMQSDVLNETVGLVDARLEQNRAQAG